MNLHLKLLAGAAVLGCSTGVLAQGRPATAATPATKAQPAMPAQPTTSTTTTTSTQPAMSAMPATPAQPATRTPDETTTGKTTAPGQMGTTPGQEQTTPGEASELNPAATGTTPSGQTTGNATSTAVTAATEADLKAGALVYDQSGALVGKVDSVSASGAVISTGKARAEIPVASFGKNDKGLVMTMTKAELQASAKSAAKPKKK